MYEGPREQSLTSANGGGGRGGLAGRLCDHEGGSEENVPNKLGRENETLSLRVFGNLKS